MSTFRPRRRKEIVLPSLLRSLMFVLVLVFTSQAFAQALVQAPAQLSPSKATQAAASPSGPEVDALLKILRDDAARARLIKALESELAEGAKPADEPPQNRVTMAIADTARRLEAAVSGSLGELTRTLQAAPARIRSLKSGASDDLAALALSLAGAIAAAFVALWIVRALARRVTGARSSATGEESTARRFVATVATIFSGTIAIIAGSLAALGVALATGGDSLVMRLVNTFVLAFAVTEGFKLVVRALLSPDQSKLRVPKLSDTSAAYWTRWFSRFFEVLAYPLLFIAPALLFLDLRDISAAVVAFTVFTAAALSIVIVMQNRRAARLALQAKAHATSSRIAGRVYLVLARTWHLLAIMAIAGFIIAWLARPEEALSIFLEGLLKTLVIILVANAAMRFVNKATGNGVPLNSHLRERLPFLERRLNALLPAIGLGVKFVVGAIAFAAIVRAWGLLDPFAWLSTPLGFLAIASIASVLVVLAAAGLVYLVVTSWIEYRLNPSFGTVPTQRERTLLALFRSGFTVVLVVVVSMTILAELGVNIGPLLAGAGVIGLAVGFGAQKLVQDVITGVFIQLENVMNEGDVVTAGGVSGVVERLTIRSVGLRDLSGSYHSIPFSSVSMVTNMMRHFSFYLADVGVAYRESIPEVKEAMAEAFDRLVAQPDHAPNIIAPFEMMGVERFDDSAVIVRARIKTAPGKQWQTGRAYNEALKEVFDERGIEIPFPHVTLYAGREKDGTAPAFLIARDPQRDEGRAADAHASSKDQAPIGKA